MTRTRRRAARRAAARGRAALRDEGQPDAGGGAAPRRGWSTASTSPRRASCTSRSTRASTRRSQLRRARARRDAELDAGGRGGHRRQRRVRARDSQRLAAHRSAARRRARGRGARQSGLRAQVLRHEDGRRAEAVRHRRRARARRCCDGLAQRRRSSSRASTSSAARRTCAPKSIIEAQQKTAAARAATSRAHAPAPVRLLNLGGGFGIPYFPGEKPLDLAPIGANLGDWSPRDPRRRCRRRSVVLELGRYLVGEAGVYVCRVIDRKVSRGQVFLVTDGGLHHHLAASGNFGQVMRKNYPVLDRQPHRSRRARGRVGRRAAVHAARPAGRPDGARRRRSRRPRRRVPVRRLRLHGEPARLPEPSRRPSRLLSRSRNQAQD